MNGLKDVLQERKVERNQLLIGKEDLDFSHEVFQTEDAEINEFLKQKAVEAANIQAKSSLALGKLFTEIFKKLSGNNRYDGLYEKWIDVNGYNKRAALRHRKRFELFTAVTDDRKSFISSLPVRIIEAISAAEDSETYIAMINEGVSKEDLADLLLNSEKRILEAPLPACDLEMIDTEIMEKAAVFNMLSRERLKDLDTKKKQKIEGYLKKIENLLKG